jgi:hypothetical protein
MRNPELVEDPRSASRTAVGEEVPGDGRRAGRRDVDSCMDHLRIEAGGTGAALEIQETADKTTMTGATSSTHRLIGRSFSLDWFGDPQHRRCGRKLGSREPVLNNEPLAHRGPALDPIILVNDHDRTTLNCGLATGISQRLGDGSSSVLRDLTDLGDPVGELDIPLPDRKTRLGSSRWERRCLALGRQREHHATTKGKKNKQTRHTVPLSFTAGRTSRPS